jgi:purine-binding chemotaxis protein CheW
MNESAGGAPVEILVVEMSGSRYGLPAAGVREVFRAVAPVPLPGAPALVEGVINVRGSVVPVFDLRRKLGIPAKPLELDDHMVIACARDCDVAVRVDRALGLATLTQEDVEDVRAPAAVPAGVRRIAKLPDGLVFMPDDLGTLLSDRGAAP